MLFAMMFVGFMGGLLTAAMVWMAGMGPLVTFVAYSLGGSATILLLATAHCLVPLRVISGKG